MQAFDNANLLGSDEEEEHEVSLDSDISEDSRKPEDKKEEPCFNRDEVSDRSRIMEMESMGSFKRLQGDQSKITNPNTEKTSSILLN